MKTMEYPLLTNVGGVVVFNGPHVMHDERDWDDPAQQQLAHEFGLNVQHEENRDRQLKPVP